MSLLGKVKESFKNLRSNNAQGEYYLTDIIEWSKTRNLKVNAFVLDNNDEIFGINSRENLAQAAKIMNERKIKELMENGIEIILSDPGSSAVIMISAEQ